MVPADDHRPTWRPPAASSSSSGGGAASSSRGAPRNNPGPTPGGPSPWPQPNPTPDVLDAQRARAAAATDRSADIIIPEDDVNVRPPDPRGGALPVPSRGAHDARRRGDVVVAVRPDGTVSRAAERPEEGIYTKKGPFSKRLGREGPAPYAPAKTESFTVAIVALFLVGVVACAVVFPFQGLRDADSDAERWEATIERWRAAGARDEDATPFALPARRRRGPVAFAAEAPAPAPGRGEGFGGLEGFGFEGFEGLEGFEGFEPDDQPEDDV